MTSATTPLPARVPGPAHAAARTAARPPAETYRAAVRGARARPAQVRAAQVRAAQVRPARVRPARVRAMLVRAARTRPALVRVLWPWLRMVGGAGILALLLWRLGTAAFVDGLRVIDRWALLSAFGIGVSTTVCSAWRWCLVARGLGLRLPLPAAIADYYRAVFLNAALPGGVVGDVHRAVRHGRDAGDVGRGVRAVVLERAAGQVVLVVVGAVVLVVYPSPVSPVGLLGRVPVGLVTGVLVAALGLAALLGLGGGRAGSWFRRVATATGRDLRDGLFSRGAGPGIAVASAAALAGHVATFLLAARVAGATAPWPVLLPLGVLTLLAMALPLNVGGWGPREGVCAWAFGAAGLGAAQGLTTAVVYGVLTFATSLPGLAVLAHRWVIRRAAGQAVPNRSDSA